MPTSTVTSKGQITIPAQVRRSLGLQAGSRVAFVATDSGSYELVPEDRPLSRLKGVVPAVGEPVTLEQMERAIREAAAESAGL
jgi:antitoxin PrlF